MKLLTFLSAVVSLFVLISCHKSGSSTPQGLNGNWNFLSMSAQTQLTSSEPGGVTAVASTNYITRNNTGTITFAGDSMVIAGMGYSVDTSSTIIFSYNNTPYDTASQAVSFSVPPTSASSHYQLVNKDSLYFPSGGLLTTFDSSATKGQGSRFTITGDSLIVSSQVIDSTGGVLTVAKSVIYMKRK